MGGGGGRPCEPTSSCATLRHSSSEYLPQAFNFILQAAEGVKMLLSDTRPAKWASFACPASSRLQRQIWSSKRGSWSWITDEQQLTQCSCRKVHLVCKTPLQVFCALYNLSILLNPLFLFSSPHILENPSDFLQFLSFCTPNLQRNPSLLVLSLQCLISLQHHCFKMLDFHQ